MRTLIAVAFTLGLIWDIAFEQVGAWAGWWRFARGFEGLTIFGGTRYTLSLPVSYYMAITYTVCVYLAGRTDANGHTLIEAWARQKASTPTSALLLNLGATILAVQLTYFSLLVPNIIAKVLNLQTVVYNGELFDGLAPQPGLPPDPSLGWPGTLFIMVCQTVLFAAFVGAVLRFDPLAKRRAQVPPECPQPVNP